ncbi:MAG: GAF domain-containing protein [Anaerolineae bacterium]|nr:GAF domain-containing protein [Anaerolineae bacterium]
MSSNSSDAAQKWDKLREKIIGLGERSISKSYYPELQRRLTQLERFRALLDQSHEAIFLIELPTGYLVDANIAACRLVGCDIQDLLGKSFSDFGNQNLIKWQDYVLAKHAAPGEYLTFSSIISQPDLGQVFLEVTIRWVDFEGILYAVLVARDITERHAYEAERDRWLKDLEWHAQLLSTSSEISQVAASILNLDELLEEAVDLIATGFGFYCVSMLLVDDTGEWVTLQAISKRDLLLPTVQIGQRTLINESSIIGRCILTQQTQISSDFDIDDEELLVSEVRAEMAVPLLSRGRVIAVMVICASDFESFSKEDVLALQSMARNLTTAIENAWLFEKTQTTLFETRSLFYASRMIGEAVNIEQITVGIAKVAEALGFTACSLTVLTNLGEQTGAVRGDFYGVLIASNGVRLVPGVKNLVVTRSAKVRDVITQPEFMITYDVNQDSYRTVDPDVLIALRFYIGVQGGAMVGLSLRGQPLGFVCFSSVEPVQQFSLSYIHPVRTISDQVAVAVANVRLLASLAEEKSRLELLYRLGQYISKSLDVHMVAQRALDEVRSTLRAACGLVWVQKISGADLQLVASTGFNVNAEKQLEEYLNLPFGLGISGSVARDQQSTLVPDVLEDPRWISFEGFDDWVKSVLSVPLISEGVTLGVMTFYSESKAFFNTEHLLLVKSVAATVSAAIANARLFGQTQRRVHEQGVVSRIVRALNALDIHQAFLTLVQSLEDFTGCQFVSLFLLREDSFLGNIADLSSTMPVVELGQEFDVRSLPGWELNQQGKPAIITFAGDAPSARGNLFSQAGLRSYLSLPLLVSGRVMGVLMIGHQQPATFDEYQLPVLLQIADALAIGVEKERLFEAEREQRCLAEALEAAAAAVSSTLDIEEVLDRILEQVARVVNGDTFNIMLLEGESARIVRARGYQYFGGNAVACGNEFQVALYPNLVNMVQLGKSIVVPDTLSDPLWVSSQTREWRRSYVAAPIKIGGVVQGFLNVNGTRPGQFHTADLQRLESFAAHAATAIHNAQLFEQQLKYAAELEQRVAERTSQLQSQYAQLSAILNSTSDGIIVTNARGEIIDINPVADDWLNQRLLPEDADQLRTQIREVVAHTGARSERLLEFHGLDLQIKASPITEDYTSQPLVVVAVHDITHLRSLDRMKSRLVSNVSHELRTPVTTIKLLISLLRRSPPERWDVYLDGLEQEAERQSQLIHNILQISRIESGRLELRLERLALDELAGEVVSSHEILAKNRQLTLVHKVEGDAIANQEAQKDAFIASVDRTQITQVLNNLVENALYYTPEGGNIEVLTGLAYTKGREWITITVTDTGIGIPESELAQIFERFFRGEAPRQKQIPGSGLGLSIVKEVLALHGGWIDVESQEGAGSKFTIWLPA